MKKTLTLLALLLISMGAMAQFEVKSKEKSSEHLTDNLVYSYKYNDYTLVFRTDNQFDDVMLINIGAKDDAIKAIDALMEIVNIKDEQKIEIDNGYGKTYKIYTSKSYTMMKGDYYAGWAYITKKILTKAKEAIINKDISSGKPN